MSCVIDSVQGETKRKYRYKRNIRMAFIAQLEKPKPRRTPVHIFQSETTALEHLKAYGIEPQDKRFVIIAERHYGDKNFDALDYLMYNHHYKVNFV